MVEVVPMSTKIIEMQIAKRQRYKFIARNTNTDNAVSSYWTYPCIVMIEMTSGVIVAYTKYERYLRRLDESENLSGRTLTRLAMGVCNFLNYLLYRTNITSINQLTPGDINRYHRYLSIESGLQQDTYKKYAYDVSVFLKNYYDFNHENVEFHYTKDTIPKTVPKSPYPQKKKFRTLLNGFEQLLIYCAKAYDPMLTLPIMTQLYSGVREGEIVNLTIGKIKCEPPWGVITSITIDVKSNANHWGNVRN